MIYEWAAMTLTTLTIINNPLIMAD